MTLDEVLEERHKDSQLDRTELGEEALKIPQLHSKYYKLYANERLKLRRLQAEHKQLVKAKNEYFGGTIDYNDMKERGWEPNPLKILRADIPSYVDADQEVVNINLKMAYHQEIVDFLDNAIRSLNTRGYNISAAINWEKFKVGI